MTVVKRRLERSNIVKTVTRWGGIPLLLLPLAVVQGANQTRIDKTFEATANPHIALSNFMGHVVVRGWDKPQVHAVYATGSPLATIDIDQLPNNGPAEKIHFTTHVCSAGLEHRNPKPRRPGGH